MVLTANDCRIERTADSRCQSRMAVRRDMQVFEPFAGQTLSAVTRNVSVGGLCLEIAGRTDLRPGRFVTLHGAPTVGPRLCEDTERAFTARVVWTTVDADHVTRVGLQVYSKPVAVAA